MKWMLLSVAFVLAGCEQQTTTGGPAPIDPEIAKLVKLQILDFEQIEALIASHKGKLVVIDCWSTS